MADYTVNLRLAVQGSKDLEKLNRKIEKTRKHLNKAEIGSDKFNKSIEKLIKRENKYGQALNRRTKAIDNAIRAQTGMQTVEQREHQLLMRGNKLRDLRARKDRALNRQKMVNRGVTGAIGSGIIGGGFPLLFGQGPTAAIGGALGGVAGGALSAIPGMGQMGFALSIAGTTIGSALDDLSKALAKPTENIEKLVSKFGLAGTETGDLALELEKLGLKAQAAELLLEKGQEQLGFSAEEIELNTKKLQEFENQINLLGTQITLFLADHLTPFLEELQEFGKNPKENIEQAIMGPEGRFEDYFGTGGNFFEKALSFLMFGPGGDPTQQFERFKKKYLSTSNIPAGEGNAIINGVPINPDFGKPGITASPSSSTVNPLKSKIDLARTTFEQKELLPLKQALELEQLRLTTSTEKLTLKKEEFALVNIENELQFEMSQRTEEVNKELEKKIEKLEIARDTQAQVVENTKALIDPFRQVSGIIAQDMGNGIKELIKGTTTLGDLLNNVLNKMIDGFLNLGLFGNFGGTFTRGSGLLGMIPGFRANGGPVKGGSSYIVGERGPELFTPGVSGRITPNEAMGGPTNIVVNVDATGSAVEGDDQQGRELGLLISAAIQSELIEQKRPGGLLA